MAWIELHQSLPTHRKTIECAAMLDISLPQMVGHLCCFWLWALDNSDDGVLSQLRNVTVALASRWQGDPDEFIDALIATNFLEKDGETLKIHDWYEYAGRLLEQRKANRERQRRYREKNKNNSNGDITVTCALRNGATVPNRTLPNQKNTTTPQKGVEESDDSPTSGRSKPVPAKEIFEAWNEVWAETSIPKMRELTKARRTWIKREYSKQRDGLASVDEFRAFFVYLRDDCPFIRDSVASGKTWFSFDWLFKWENNFTKALEGNYEARK